MSRAYITILFAFMLSCSVQGQPGEALHDSDKTALEGIIVEKYYVAEESDYADTSGGVLPKGSVTYRIYVDMKPGYWLQLVYGDKNHELLIKTTTTFFNNTIVGAYNGYQVSRRYLNEGTIALDSWLSMGAATSNQLGIPLSDDKNGSIIKRSALAKADGLTDGNLPVFKSFNLNLNFFNDSVNNSVFATNNGGWAGLSGIKGGVKGPADDNKVLIAQLTTDGKLSFELNLQIGTPSGSMIHYVANSPEGNEIKFDGLTVKDLIYN